jgi:hypothetical protein
MKVRKTKDRLASEPVRPRDTTVQEIGHRDTYLGAVLYIRISTPNHRQLTWDEVWATFADAYPGRWAIEMYPPAEAVINERNIYHLFVLENFPRGFDMLGRHFL